MAMAIENESNEPTIPVQINRSKPNLKKNGRPITWTDERIDKVRLLLQKWIDNPKNYFFTSFLTEANLDYVQVQRLATINESFGKTYAQALRIQEQRLVEMAIEKPMTGNFIKFVLQNKANWREKQEISGDANNPLSLLLNTIGQNHKEPIEIEPTDVQSVE